MKIQNLTKEVINQIAGAGWPEDDNTLDLSGHIISHKLLTLILKAINNNPLIHHLHLCQCFIENPNAIKQIALTLETNKSLKSLYLSHNNITPKQATTLFTALNKNKTLKNLNLNHNLIGDGITERDMGNSIKNIRSLESLDMSHNGIQQVTATTMAKALQKNKSLLSININDNLINEAGIESFLNILLEKNQTLTELHTTQQYNPILTYKTILHNKAQKIIDRHINKNKTLRTKIKKVQKKVAAEKKSSATKSTVTNSTINKKSSTNSDNFSKKFKKLFNYVFSAK